MSAPVASSSSTAESHRTNSTASPPSNAATGPSSPRLSSPMFPPVSFRAAAGPRSISASRTTTSPPTTTTTTATATTATTSTSTVSSSSASTQLHVSEARAALVASVSNMLDSELQSRAGLLHANAAALGKQERDVERATDGLRRENDKLARVARDAGRKIKELGNVQNWAEVLERDFLVLEETMRIVRGDDDDDDEEDVCSVCSGGCFCSWSGSERSASASRRGSVVEANGNDNKREINGVVGDKDKDKDKDAAKAITTNSSGGGIETVPVPVPAPNVEILADDALLESLTEAMATEMRVSQPDQHQQAVDDVSPATPDKGKGPLCQNQSPEKKDNADKRNNNDDDATLPPPLPESTAAPSTSSPGEETAGDNIHSRRG
ncbi:hypothetical protein F4810DRAFT_179550 [Camillea tinctor]|nr:hypothetical protein F4810DRAFT_179550 [Camillea tinctor]